MKISNLNLLKGVTEQAIEEQRRLIGDQQSVIESLRSEREAISREIQHEIDACDGNPGMSDLLPAYLARRRGDAASLDRRIEQQEAVLEDMIETIRDMFMEAKKFEVVIDRQKAEHMRELERRNQQFLDWLAGRRRTK